MKAIIFRGKDKPLFCEETEKPQPAAGEVLVQLHYAAYNHRDLWLFRERTDTTPVIPGSDGSGIVETVGAGVAAGWIGKEVLINPSLNWGDDPRFTGAAYQILGVPGNGTFAEYISIPQAYVYHKPQHLALEEAAALPLAGLTAYRALFSKAAVSKTNKVLITGIGGGVALYALQMAYATGAEVHVTSSSAEKIERAKSLGAKAGYNYRDADWVKQATETAGGFDVIIDSAGGDGFAALTEVANPGCRMVVIGRTAGNINNLKPGIIFNKQLHIMGTVMGTQEEFGAMLNFYAAHQLHPVIDRCLPIEQLPAMLTQLEQGQQFGKLVFKIA